MEMVGFIVFFGITCMILFTLGWCKVAGNNIKDEKRLRIAESDEQIIYNALKAEAEFKKRAAENKSVLPIQSGLYEDSKVMIIDSRIVYDCPFHYQWAGRTVKLNSGYCRSSCKRRNYTVKSPSDHFVACNKGQIK